jgi:hypothetical protein
MAYEKGIDSPTIDGARGLCAVLSIVTLIAATGCSSFGRRSQNLVELQLREQRVANDKLREKLESTQAALSETQKRIKTLRESPPGSEVTLTSGASPAFSSIDRLELSSLLSGGLDRDAVPGDELLSVLATPVDKSGNAVRADGSLTITAFDYALPADDQTVGQWEWDVETTATLWSDGVVGTGYRLTEQWQKQPRSKRIVLHARFVTTEGRQFDATQTVTIDVPAREDSGS